MPETDNFCKMLEKLIKIELIKFSKTDYKLITFQQDQERQGRGDDKFKFSEVKATLIGELQLVAND